jgi:hypothetical protein
MSPATLSASTTGSGAARQAGTPAVRGHGTAAGHAHPAPNDIDPQGPGRSGRDAIAPGPGLDRSA